MQSLTQPSLLLKPFAESGDKNTLPVNNTDVSNPQLADLTNGFPQITSESPDNGGLPPERKDFNALGYLTTTYDFFYQAGGVFTFNSTVSTAIGGYPLNALLWYTDGNGATTVLRSTKVDNTDDFNSDPSYIGTSWSPEIPVLGWSNTWTANNTFSQNVSISGNLNVGGTGSFSGSSTFSGSATFSSSVNLGSSATATTKSVSNDSTAVATTGYVKDCVPKSVGSTSKPVYSNANGVITTCDLGIPDYANPIEFTSTTYTPNRNGIIRAAVRGSNAMVAIMFGNFTIVRSECADGSAATEAVWAIVKNGQTYTIDYRGSDSHRFFFIPFA